MKTHPCVETQRNAPVGTCAPAATTPPAAIDVRVDGVHLLVRPVRPEDRPHLSRMFYRLSPTTIHRWLGVGVPHTPQGAARLGDLAVAPTTDRYNVVALHADEIIGIAYYVKEKAAGEAEVAMVIEDAWQDRGLGKVLLTYLAEAAVAQRVSSFTAFVQYDNRRALGVLAAVFAERTRQWADGVIQVRMRVQASTDHPVPFATSLPDCGHWTRQERPAEVNE